MKSIVCIFAHPDDEAMGPGGTIAKLAQENNVYLLCATKGHAGNNSSSQSQEKIFRIRTQELLNSARILGIKNVTFLGFRDGYLANHNYHKLADKIQKKLEEIKPDTIITFEPRGISGHLDHIAVSLVTTFIFYKLPFIKELLYFCITEKHRKLFGQNYFIYVPPGYKTSEIDLVIDISSVWEKKLSAIQQHKSQQQDVDSILEDLKQLSQEEHFVVLKK